MCITISATDLNGSLICIATDDPIEALQSVHAFEVANLGPVRAFDENGRVLLELDLIHLSQPPS